MTEKDADLVPSAASYGTSPPPQEGLQAVGNGRLVRVTILSARMHLLDGNNCCPILATRLHRPQT